MLEKILEYIIANAVIGGIATGIYFGIKKLKKPVLCKHCKFLIRAGDGGGVIWKYQCTMGDTCKIIFNGFDRPPEYCRYYESREVERDEL